MAISTTNRYGPLELDIVAKGDLDANEVVHGLQGYMLGLSAKEEDPILKGFNAQLTFDERGVKIGLGPMRLLNVSRG